METTHENISIYELDQWHYQNSEQINNLFHDNTEDFISFLQTKLQYDPSIKNGVTSKRCWGYDVMGRSVYYLDEYTLLQEDELYVFKNNEKISLDEKVMNDCKNKFMGCAQRIKNYLL